MIHIRPMTFADQGLGLWLRQQAGWNQTPADWGRFLSLQPDGCFVAEEDGTAVGTVTTCIFGPVAWIGMMLVEQGRRGRGIGRALMMHALEFLEGKKIRTIRLDASPQGEPLYRKLGFSAQFVLGRFGGDPVEGKPAHGVEAGTREDWEPAARLDRMVTNTERRALLLELFRENPEQLRVVRRGGVVVGFVTARRGARAYYLGPCAATVEAGPLLLSDVLNRFTGRSCFMDIPVTHEPAVALVRQRGLREQRQLLRMCRGEELRENIQQLWASSGPEKG
jgi:GNAT superfamily N-acetyltransferase